MTAAPIPVTTSVQDEHQVWNVTTAASTARLTPQTDTFRVPLRQLVRITLTVPRGHQGLTGIEVETQGLQLVPFNQPGTFVIADESRFDWPIALQVDGTLTAKSFNTDVWPHTFYFILYLTSPPLAPSAGPTELLPIA